MNKKSTFQFIIGSLLIMGLVLLIFNQYYQHEELQRREQIDAETTRQYQEMVNKLEQESQKGSPLKDMKGGRLP